MTLTLGDLPQSLAAARQSVELADRSGDSFMRMGNRTTLGDALHQAGYLTEAEAEFLAAEALQQERQPEFPLLYSVQGFRHCNLLLNQGQWQEVNTRAAQMLEWAKQVTGVSLLDIALIQLTLGCAHLGLAQQADGSAPSAPAQHLAQAGDRLQRAVDGLRQAGYQYYLPLGLLARAAWARMAQEYDRAHRDLAEARAIAERGAMRLHLCDYHLEAARLHLAQGHSDEAGDHWAKAREMVAEMGYHRRDAEVAAIGEEFER